mmetsp:Transcript_94386/g.271911  ORF Transcript_94386/g.271911 Transcript_94386/m.271911 type:complete len:221 (+) Transcript_94386:573-1235(+)
MTTPTSKALLALVRRAVGATKAAQPAKELGVRRMTAPTRGAVGATVATAPAVGLGVPLATAVGKTVTKAVGEAATKAAEVVGASATRMTERTEAHGAAIAISDGVTAEGRRTTHTEVAGREKRGNTVAVAARRTGLAEATGPTMAAASPVTAATLAAAAAATGAETNSQRAANEHAEAVGIPIDLDAKATLTAVVKVGAAASEVMELVGRARATTIRTSR